MVKMRGDAFEGTRVPALGSRGRDDDKGGTLWMRDGAFSWSRASTLGLEGCDNDLGGAVQMRGDAVDASHDLSLVWWIHGREKGVAVRVLGAAFSGARVRHPGRGEATTKRMLRYRSWLLHAPGHVSHHLVRGDGMSMLAGLERSGAMLSTGPVFRQSELSDRGNVSMIKTARCSCWTVPSEGIMSGHSTPRDLTTMWTRWQMCRAVLSTDFGVRGNVTMMRAVWHQCVVELSRGPMLRRTARRAAATMRLVWYGYGTGLSSRLVSRHPTKRDETRRPVMYKYEAAPLTEPVVLHWAREDVTTMQAMQY